MQGSDIGFAPIKIDSGDDIYVISGVSGQLLKVDKNLKPGGLFLAIHFLFPLSEEGPPFGASQQEILDQFSPYFKLLEQWKPNSFEGRENEERMFLWSKN